MIPGLAVCVKRGTFAQIQPTDKRKDMKISLIGYGKMGRAVGEAAIRRGHTVVATLDEGWQETDLPAETEMAIEFTRPAEAARNIGRLLELGLPVVSGTTGWLDEGREAVRRTLEATHGALFYSSNYSIGVYLFRQMVRRLAAEMNLRPDFSEISMEEIHHIHKLDYPSGTALTIARDDLLPALDRKSDVRAYLAPNPAPALGDEAERTILIKSIREGEVAGVHRVEFRSPGVEAIRIEHESLGRESLALGAVLAAEFLLGKSGLFGMDDLMAPGDDGRL